MNEHEHAPDKIVLSGIELYAWGGVSEAERATGQRYRVDVQLGLDLAPAGESDAIEDTIHYGLLHDLVVDAMRSHPFELIESAATRVAGAILDRFPAVWVTVRLAKLLPPIDGVVQSAAVEITRYRTASEASPPGEHQR